MVFGINAPRTLQIDHAIHNNESIEVFPNSIINVNSDIRLSQQIHYLINHKKTGVYHLGSTDLISHFDFIKNIVQIERKLDSPLNCKKIGTNWKKQEKPTLCPKLSTQLYFVECMVDPYRCPCLFKILVEVTLAPLYANEKEQ